MLRENGGLDGEGNEGEDLIDLGQSDRQVPANFNPLAPDTSNQSKLICLDCDYFESSGKKIGKEQ